MNNDKRYFFCGIGGSGMLPLATILTESGAQVSGSDRALDNAQRGTAAKFDWLRAKGIALFPQDGSGLTSGEQILVASAAIEDTVPDIAAAARLGCERLTRAELNSRLFNAAETRIGVAGTSGKSTVTGMAGYILAETGRDPTIMNGAVMTNFASDDAPFLSSRTGDGAAFVSEVDESDGSIALYRPTVAVLNNVSLDHKSLEELHALFGDFVEKADVAIWNADDAESRAVLSGRKPKRAVTFGFGEDADFRATEIAEAPFSISFRLQHEDIRFPVTLRVPGRHNVMNALAALAAAHAAGVPVAQAAEAIGGFAGLKRRFELVGRIEADSGEDKDAITVIDDFGHNPEKIAATLDTLKAFPGRIIAFFQPHGYGPLKVMGEELAAMFAETLTDGDRLILCDPVYFGGTTNRSIGSAEIVGRINTLAGRGAGGNGGAKIAEHIPDREDCGEAIRELMQPGDRIVVMGARDDSLSVFARGLLER